MTERHQSLLTRLVEHYIQTAQPISSAYLAGACSPSVSSATVRNDLAELEAEGYVAQPHTSAGRIPTQKAYEAYVRSIETKSVPVSIQADIASCLSAKSRDGFKQLAQYTAQITTEMVYIAFGRHDTYYTGLRNLVSKPEFFEQELLEDITGLIDQLDMVVDQILETTEDGVQTRIGTESGFGPACSTILMRYTLDTTECVFGLLGPMRMNYASHIRFLKEAHGIINS